MPPSNVESSLIGLQQDILKEALAICRGRPVCDVRQPRVAHLLGAMAVQRGRADLAITYLTRSIRACATDPAPFSTLGDALFQKNRRIEALAAHLRALVLARHAVDGWTALARALHRQNYLPEAVVVYGEAVRLRPNSPELHRELGDVYCSQRQYSKALASYTRALELGPDHPDIHGRLGQMWLQRQNWRQALRCFQLGLTLTQKLVDLHLGAGEALLRMNRPREAERAFHAALGISPRDIAANRQFVIALELLGRVGDAVSAWKNFGLALESHGRFQDAAAAYLKAVARDPECLRALIGLGRVYSAAGEPETAVRYLRAAVAADPQDSEAHIELGHTLQSLGQLEEGWKELVWYHHPDRIGWRYDEHALWDGTALGGRTILLWTDAEMSPSEVICYLRFVRFAKAAGGRVVVECNRALIPLVCQMPEVDEVICHGGPLVSFEVHAPLRHFPALVHDARPSIPASDLADAAYLSVCESDRRVWREVLNRRASGAARMIGVAWAADPEPRQLNHRSASLAEFAHLGLIPNVRLVSLQRGIHRHELLAPPEGLMVEDLLPETGSLLDLAGLIVNLDLIITVDSVVAHLAGSLGAPVWTLLSRDAGWPWPVDAKNPRWYPTMRFFRMRRAGEWVHVLIEVAQTARQTLMC